MRDASIAPITVYARTMPVYGRNKSPTNTRNFGGPNFGTNHSAVRPTGGGSSCVEGSCTERVVVAFTACAPSASAARSFAAARADRIGAAAAGCADRVLSAVAPAAPSLPQIAAVH